MKYKALMLDLDGTTVPSAPHALPSKRVTEAIQKVSGTIHVCIATGRSIYESQYILDALQLSGPCVLNHRAQVYDPVKKESIKEVVLSSEQIERIVSVFHNAGLPVYIFADPEKKEYDGSPIHQPVYGLWSRGATDAESQILEKGFRDISHITVNKVQGWDGGMSYEITHADATKQHGVMEVAQILGIEKEDIIGVGDGYNDFPLLMACGLKIAMGNAVPELKAIADFVAPSVDEDGVAVVIEKFLLS